MTKNLKRQFTEGDQVLVLLPVIGSPFQAKFVGPYTVVRQLSELNYLISTPDRRKRNQLCHKSTEAILCANPSSGEV